MNVKLQTADCKLQTVSPVLREVTHQILFPDPHEAAEFVNSDDGAVGFLVEATDLLQDALGRTGLVAGNFFNITGVEHESAKRGVGLAE